VANKKAIALRALTILVTVLFLLAGGSKFLAHAGWIHRFEVWGYPAWFVPVVGAVEVIGALCLLHRRTARYGSVALAVMMFGALYTHVAAKEIYSIIRPAVFLGLLAGARLGTRLAL
jgi:uncharacterized membrane protein YphA (DoxX/SURF4 family)